MVASAGLERGFQFQKTVAKEVFSRHFSCGLARLRRAIKIGDEWLSEGEQASNVRSARICCGRGLSFFMERACTSATHSFKESGEVRKNVEGRFCTPFLDDGHGG
jgi:hypothetical protein